MGREEQALSVSVQACHNHLASDPERCGLALEVDDAKATKLQRPTYLAPSDEATAADGELVVTP
jgi:hypothetical protein